MAEFDVTVCLNNLLDQVEKQMEEYETMRGSVLSEMIFCGDEGYQSGEEEDEEEQNQLVDELCGLMEKLKIE
ncbi:hypothetical protein L5515_017202 [Caenorhabditis briggsae]|uniref:Uncharacterized protein n=1 Tax=Caenorhabditis briggsae TaxID=6238 RepID=A0AAE9FD88_CAEBR|nr:hypothetical protein L5515_017202 [Caenorhabditis briggsae]